MPTYKAISPNELLEIKEAYTELFDKVSPKFKGDDEENINEAFELALEAHGEQRRKSGEPYIMHPIEVARICFEEIGLGPTAVIGAILHDVVEDTQISQSDILDKFGPKVSKIVDGLTKIDGLYNNESSPQAANLKKVLSTLVEDVRVILIKLADRLHNMRTIDSMPRHKQIGIAAETSYIYVPLAHRLGLYNIKKEIEDIILKIKEPEDYNYIISKIKETEGDRKNYIQDFFKPLSAKLDKLKEDTNGRYKYMASENGDEALTFDYRILGRTKAVSSIYNKLKTKKVPFEKIYDLFAIRIIADVPIEEEKQICWQIYSIVTDVYKPIPERLKDWITSPKGNGYESLHTTVIGPEGRYVEVQVRTERMDEIAEKGFAAHWKYKGVNTSNNVYDRWLNNIREILDTQHSDAIEFLNDFKTNLFSEEVYVFTPNGDMRVLPKGATALDFAFDIHSDLGYKTTAIKVNNKIVPMGYKLQNGDQLEIITSKNQKPSESWLKMVVTGKARSKIRASMKEDRRAKGILGKEALERKLRNMKVGFDENVDLIVKHFGYQSRPDLYFDISNDDFKMAELKVFTVENQRLVAPAKEPPKGNPAPTDEQTKTSPKSAKTKISTNILVNDEPIDQYKYDFARCCKPVQGDPIFAYLTSENSLKIHRLNCTNAENLLMKYGYRVLKAEWTRLGNSEFIAELMIKGVDSGVGVIQTLTNVISNDLQLNMRSFSIKGKEGYFEGLISVLVKNKDQLKLAMDAIEKLDGIYEISRVEK